MALVRGRIVPDSATKVALDEAWRTGEMPAAKARDFASKGLVILAGPVAYVRDQVHVRLTKAGKRARRA